jgi:predicted dehydrogenase
MNARHEEAAGIAVIGAGMVAGTHLAAIAASEKKLLLKGVLSRQAKNAENLLSKLNLPLLSEARIYTSLEEIASSDNVDFALLITPPNVRVDMVESLAKAGKPILMEKPIARNLAEARQIVETCEEADVPLGVVFQHRFREASIEAQALVASQRLGPLYLAEITVPWWRPQSYYEEAGRGSYTRDGGGVLINQAIHTMDLALSLTGPVSCVQAMTATTTTHEMEAEDFAVAGLRYANGAAGSLVASTASFPGASETIRLHFEKASLELVSGVLWLSWRDGRTEQLGEVASTGGGADPMAFTHEWHQAVIEDFVEALRDGRPPAVTGREALRVHSLIDAIEQSARSGCLTNLEADI